MVRVAKMRRIGLALLGVPVLVAVLQTILAAVDARVSFLDDLAYGSPYMRVWFVIYGMVLSMLIRMMMEPEVVRDIRRNPLAGIRM